MTINVGIGEIGSDSFVELLSSVDEDGEPEKAQEVTRKIMESLDSEGHLSPESRGMKFLRRFIMKYMELCLKMVMNQGK